MNKIPIIGQQEEQQPPQKHIQISPDGGVVIQVQVPGLIASTVIITPQEMTDIDRLRMEIKLQQKKEMQLVRHALETKHRE